MGISFVGTTADHAAAEKRGKKNTASKMLRIMAAAGLLAAFSLFTPYGGHPEDSGGGIQSADAQGIPIPPPPFPGIGSSAGQPRVAENDRSPPKIEILTGDLAEGRNVFKVRITDESSLLVREVRFVQNGHLTTEGLFRDQNDVYKALIDIHHPSRIVVVTAGDANGNTASAFREYDIEGSGDVLSQAAGMLSRIEGYIRNALSQYLPVD